MASLGLKSKASNELKVGEVVQPVTGARPAKVDTKVGEHSQKLKKEIVEQKKEETFNSVELDKPAAPSSFEPVKANKSAVKENFVKEVPSMVFKSVNKPYLTSEALKKEKPYPETEKTPQPKVEDPDSAGGDADKDPFDDSLF